MGARLGMRSLKRGLSMRGLDSTYLSKLSLLKVSRSTRQSIPESAIHTSSLLSLGINKPYILILILLANPTSTTSLPRIPPPLSIPQSSSPVPLRVTQASPLDAYLGSQRESAGYVVSDGISGGSEEDGSCGTG